MLFSSHGLRNTTIEDIILSAGVTKGAFYHYFKSKESLCTEVVEKLRLDYQELFDSFTAITDPLKKLSAILDKLAQLNASGEWINSHLLLQLTCESHHAEPGLEQKINEFHQWYREVYKCLLKQCREAGRVNTEFDLDTQVDMLLSGMAGAIALAKSSPSKTSLREIARLLMEALSYRQS